MAQDKGRKKREADADRDNGDLGARGLNLIYRKQRSDGQQSNFLRRENPGREDA